MDEQAVVEAPVKEVDDLLPFGDYEKPAEKPPEAPAEPPKLPEVKKDSKAPMGYEKGALAPKNFDDFWKLATLYYRSAVAPRKAGFDSIEKVASALEYCSKKGLIFQSAVGNMVWINDRLTVWGELPAAICRMSGEVEVLNTIAIDNDYNEICMANKNLHIDPFAFVTTIKRKGHPQKEFAYSKKDAERANLLSKDIWKGHWPIMMRRKSIGLALKFEMPDVLMGLGIEEYDFDTATDLKDVTPEKPSTQNYISAKYGNDVCPDVAPIVLPQQEATPNAEAGHLPVAPMPQVVS